MSRKRKIIFLCLLQICNVFFLLTVAAVLEHEAIAGLSGSKPSGMRGRTSSRAEDTPEYSLDSLMKSVSKQTIFQKNADSYVDGLF